MALTQLSLHENVREYWENEGGLAIVTQAKFAKENAMYWAHQASSEEFRKFTSLRMASWCIMQLIILKESNDLIGK